MILPQKTFFSKLFDETQMSTPSEATRHHILTHHWSFYTSEPFTLARFNMRHPVYPRYVYPWYVYPYTHGMYTHGMHTHGMHTYSMYTLEIFSTEIFRWKFFDNFYDFLEEYY